MRPSKFKIRKAVTGDASSLVDLAVRVAQKAYPEVRVDRSKVRKIVITILSGSQNFCEVVESEEKIVGCVAVHVFDGSWFLKKEAQVLMVYTEIPGTGIEMLRDMMKWYRSRRIVKTLTCCVDFKAGHIFDRIGLTNSGSLYRG